MTLDQRLEGYLDHMRQAALDACAFVDDLSKSDFLADKRTQQAVIMSLIIIGEAATKVMDGYATFVEVHPEVPWRNMRGNAQPHRSWLFRHQSRCGLGNRAHSIARLVADTPNHRSRGSTIVRSASGARCPSAAPATKRSRRRAPRTRRPLRRSSPAL